MYLTAVRVSREYMYLIAVRVSREYMYLIAVKVSREYRYLSSEIVWYFQESALRLTTFYPFSNNNKHGFWKSAITHFYK